MLKERTTRKIIRLFRNNCLCRVLVVKLDGLLLILLWKIYINHCLPKKKGILIFFYDNWLAIIEDGAFSGGMAGPSGKLLLLAGGVFIGVQLVGLFMDILNFIPIFLGSGMLSGWMKLWLAGILEYILSYLDFYIFLKWLLPPFGI